MVFRLKYDPDERGYLAFLKEYEEVILKMLWENRDPLGSREVHVMANARLAPVHGLAGERDKLPGRPLGGESPTTG